MHVLFVGSFLWTSGDRRGMPSVYKCLKGFEESGHKVTAVFPTNDPSLPSELDYEGMHFHLVRIPLIPYESRFSHLVGVHGVRYRFAMLGKFWSGCFYIMFLMLASLRVLRICLSESVDLIYGLSCVGAAPASLVGGVLRKPVVLRVFGTRICPFKHIEWRWVREFPEFLQFWLPKEVMVMTNDGTHGNWAALGLGTKPSRLFFWVNGLDKEHLLKSPDPVSLRKELGIGDDERVVIVVSRLARWKRVDRAIDAFVRVAREFPKARLLIMGDGEERPKLEAQARSTGLGERIRFLGSKSREEIASYYYLGEVMLYTSTLTSLSNCVMEVMVCGTPMVVTDAGGVREVCHDGENAVVVPEDDIEAIAVAVIDLLKDESKRKRIAENARRFAMEEISTWDERAKREVGMVEELERRFRLHVRPRSPKVSLLPDIAWPELYR